MPSGATRALALTCHRIHTQRPQVECFPRGAVIGYNAWLTKGALVIRRSLVLGSAAAVLASILALQAPLSSGDEPGEKKITLLYTTDIHGHYLAHVGVSRSKDDTKAPAPHTT